ncbi:MAG TPA: hypothetical protein VKD90_12340 [Gemmataceae bacterium]|nr:hypothetical protein [Gemmataceae bacterium]
MACIDPHDVEVNPGTGRAVMDVEDLDLEDYSDFVNSLVDGPSLAGRASFRVEWSRSTDRHRFRYAPEKWTANMVFNTARVQWEGETSVAHFVTDATGPQDSLFADVGHERSGAFFR